MTVSDERGYLAVPASGEGPAVLVLHAWWGLTSVFRDVCDRLAAEGFVAYAPDMFGGRSTDRIEEAERLVNEADGERTVALALAAIDRLRGHAGVRGGPIGIVGFSFGAAYALLVSTLRPEDVGAVTVFYGSYPIDFSAARASYLGHFAESDPYEPAESVAETEGAIRAAGRPVEFHTYAGTGHWFFERNRPDAYDAAAAEQAWSRSVAFLRGALGA